jgi:Uma2 family endonuclease
MTAFTINLSPILSTALVKMRQYLNNGTRLGWLLNPEAQQVEIYRPA